jgi:Na+-driven multidrug efflux pump
MFSYGNVAYAYGMVMMQAFNGAGDTVTPTILNVFCFWLWELPLAYGLAIPARLGAGGVYLSVVIAEATLALLSVLVFRRGRWKQKRI